MVKSVFEEQIDLLLATAKIVADTVDLNETLRSILKLLSEKRHLDRGTITLLDEKTGILSISVAHGLSPKAQELGRYQVGEGITGKVVQNGRAVIIPDIRKDPFPEPDRRPGRARRPPDRLPVRAHQDRGQDHWGPERGPGIRRAAHSGR